jgi:anti-sigma factor RsiW
MSNPNDRCDPDLMARYFDSEVSERERERAQAHAAGCAACRSLLEQNRTVADLFRADPDAVLTDAERAALEARVIALAGRWPSGIRKGWKAVLAPKRLIPLAAVAGLLMVGFSILMPDRPAGPSAIVNSFQGDYQSVMILETPEKRNTIIWVVETS